MANQTMIDGSGARAPAGRTEETMMGKLQRGLAAMVSAVAIALAGAGLAQAAEGDDYPKRPIRMILPNAPGSSSDVLGRILAQKLSETLGQQVVVENHAGAGGVVGMDIAKNGPPDGYTIAAA